MKIKFIRTYRVMDGTETTYKIGQELTCTEASAQHFISRGAAEAVARPVRKKTATKAKPIETKIDDDADTIAGA